MSNQYSIIGKCTNCNRKMRIHQNKGKLFDFNNYVCDKCNCKGTFHNPEEK